jgi:protein-disulfide isomerase
MSRLRTPINAQDHIIGSAEAKISLVEYGDYQCGHCGYAYPLIKRLLTDYEGYLQFIFRNFPLREVHPMAMLAAMAAEAANFQDKFWEMHDMIYENQEYLSERNLLEFARKLNLNLQQFGRDWQSEEVLSKVENDFESGVRSGVNGTPSFFINEIKLAGYDESYESLADAVEGLLT